MTKKVVAVLKTFLLAFLIAIPVFVVREIFCLGSEEYFSSLGIHKFVENYVVCLASLVIGWIYIIIFKVMKLIKNVEI